MHIYKRISLNSTTQSASQPHTAERQCFNPSRTKRNLFYLKTHFVPCSKPLPIRLGKPITECGVGQNSLLFLRYIQSYIYYRQDVEFWYIQNGGTDSNRQDLNLGRLGQLTAPTIIRLQRGLMRPRGAAHELSLRPTQAF